MFNIFQQPYLLLAVAFVLLIAIYIMRQRYPEKQKVWHLLIPVLAVALAFGIDYLVKTDREKIKDVLDTAVTAVMQKNPDAIAPLISEDYSDRRLRSKSAVMKACKSVINSYNFKAVKLTRRDIEINGPKANVNIIVRVRSDNSNTQMPAPEYTFASLDLIFTRNPDQNWQISSTKQVKINNQTVNWNTGY